MSNNTIKSRVIVLRPKIVAKINTAIDQGPDAPEFWEQFDVTRFHMNFELNGIPTGEISIPLGYSLKLEELFDGVGINVGDVNYGLQSGLGFQTERLKTKLSMTTPYMKIKVYLTMNYDLDNSDTDNGTSTEYWPDGEQLIFDGYIVSCESTTAANEASQSSFRVGIVHWLCDLDATSAMSTLSHPTNPALFNKNLFMDRMVFNVTTPRGAQGAEQDPVFMLSTQFEVLRGIGGGSFDPRTSDIWGELLYPLLMEMSNKAAQAEPVYIPCLAASPNGEMSHNWATSAFKRFEGNNAVSGADVTSQYYVPANFADVDAGVASALSDSITTYLLGQSVDTLAAGSMWRMLLDYTSMFGLTVVPKIDTVIVAPYVATNRNIYPIELGHVSIVSKTTTLNRDIRAVCMMPHNEFSRVWGTSLSPDSRIDMCLGCYTPDKDLKNGTIIHREAPDWIKNVPINAVKASVVINNLNSIPTDEDPDTMQESSIETRGDGKGNTPDSVARASTGFFDNLAHSYYLNEVLARRTAVVVSKLRFDIGPGSVVKFNTDPLQLWNTGDDSAASTKDIFVGGVFRVTVEIDAAAATAATRFWVGHVRPYNLNDSDAYSYDSHPLYEGRSFTGTPLSDAFVEN